MSENRKRNFMELIDKPVSINYLKTLAKKFWFKLVKAVVDVEKKVMAVGGEMHADEERLLLENGSQQENLWGINIYPDKKGKDLIEFDSVINIRPSQNNFSRLVEEEKIRKKIIEIVNSLIIFS